MEEAIQKADVLIEALGWIRQFRDKVTVIKLGGSVMEDEEALGHVLLDIVFMETVGMRPVIVHGGGAAISRAVAEVGLAANFIQGRRVTDDATLAIVKRVLAGDVNHHITDYIERLGGRAMSLNFDSTNVLYGRTLRLTDDDGQPVELGWVGEVTRVDRTVIENLCYAGQIPVIPSMCQLELEPPPKRANAETSDSVTTEARKLNVNADTAATAVARALGAEKLVYLSDVNGVRTDKNDPDTLVHTLAVDEARELIRSGHIAAGMIPKVEACLATLESGVGKVHIIDGRLRHSLLLEIYTNKGVGTEIVKQRAAGA